MYARNGSGRCTVCRERKRYDVRVCWEEPQSKELVEGLQKLVQHFDARGLPVACSGPTKQFV